VSKALNASALFCSGRIAAVPVMSRFDGEGSDLHRALRLTLL
jgi:hypothetical protein